MQTPQPNTEAQAEAKKSKRLRRRKRLARMLWAFLTGYLLATVMAKPELRDWSRMSGWAKMSQSQTSSDGTTTTVTQEQSSKSEALNGANPHAYDLFKDDSSAK